ncbi:solute carrier family 16 member hermes [Arctopsyche grandis]|uniref:solute carrier family 16 member hermes n=1 Tax=Arctopsyche grandis TaxID=121162 RepID=UPI00406D9281
MAKPADEIITVEMEQQKRGSESHLDEEESLLWPLPNIELRETKKVRLGVDNDVKRPVFAGFTVGDPPKEEWILVPPDGGYGWLVLAGAMLVNILVPGTVKSFGVLFVEFLDVFDAGPAAAAWIPALCYFLYSSLGPISSILSVKYSYRTVTIIGGTFAAAGMIISCWASSVTYLYVSYGVFVGTGAGLAFPPTVYIVTSYFVKRRGLANGLCMSGSALGSIILPPVLRYLLETYGYRGAVLIMGGVTLHVWVAAIFFQPVEEHMKRVPIEVDDDDDDEDADSQQNDIFYEEDLTLDTFEEFSDPNTRSPLENGFIKPQFSITSGESTPSSDFKTSESTPVRERISSMSKKEVSLKIPSDSKSETLISTDGNIPKTSSPSLKRTETHNINSDPKISPNNGNFARSASAVVVQNLQKNLDSDRKRKVSMPVSSKNITGGSRNNSKNALSNSNSRSNIRSNPSFLKAVPEGQYQSESTDPFAQTIRRTGSNRTPKRSPSTSSFQYMSTPFHGSTLSAFQQPNEFASQLTLQSLKDSFEPVSTCCGLRKSKDPRSPEKVKERSKFFDITLLKDPIYLVILISNCTNAISYTNFIILLPSYAIKMGFDKSLAAYLLSIVSAFDLVGRIGGSALSDTGFLPKPWYFIGGLFFSGLSLALLPFVYTYATISACCGVFGLASGVYVGVTAIIMAEMLGMERLTSTYGISLFVNGILQLIGPPICGLWFERTGSYSALFTTLGLITVAGASIWVIMPYLKRRQIRINEELNKTSMKA